MRDFFMSEDVKKNEYGDTLNLPKTDFPIRAQFSIFDSAMLKRWQDEKLDEKTFHHNQGKSIFILHDGPPYANGHIHLGHAYNKISKDIITKFERMLGKHVPVVPGWDCHGLPIELKVTQEHPGCSGQELKQACRQYAQKWIEIQREEFKQLGVMMRWDQPYLTMDALYESTIVKAFGEFFKQGYIQKKLKTVPWCISCQTVLANAEIEYAERKDPSLYVLFPLALAESCRLFPEAGSQIVNLLVWTTTPWTLPLNRAVVLHPKALYALVKVVGKLVIVGKDLVEKIAAMVGETQPEILTTFVAETLIGNQVSHPFIQQFSVPIIGDGFVSLEEGTACVHSAPGCGPEDYDVGLKNNLEIFSPLSPEGLYTQDIKPVDLIGMPVIDGQIWVIKKLAELDRILFKQSIRHSYPHCWRCRKALIFRATSQWFCDLSQHNLKNRALAAIQDLHMLPASGKNRFAATLEGRLEWCLSRQRTWGVPIPALHCKDCSHVFTTSTLIGVTAEGIAAEGIEFWDKVALEALGSYKCLQCQSTHLGKEYDIVDVWFESGVSHLSVLNEKNEQKFPADLYLEGKDQHRAWFQSSLLTSLVLEGKASMKEIVTHGFTVDEHGKKMSKSLGNVVIPGQIVEKIGTDGLRLWVASNDYDSDPVVSELLLKNVSEVYRKIRNTSRFLLSNLYDFDIDKDGVSVESMMPIDQYGIMRLHDFNVAVQKAYQDRKTTAVFHLLADFCAKDLSAFYLDIIKDRLYVEQAQSLARCSAQTVCYHILHTMTLVMAPILSLTAEQIFDHYKKPGTDSIHLQNFADLSAMHDDVLKFTSRRCNKSFTDHSFAKIWDTIFMIRSHVLKELEVLREQGVVKHSLDGAVRLYITQAFAGNDSLQDFYSMIDVKFAALILKEYFIVSQVLLLSVQDSQMKEIAPGLFIGIEKAGDAKCKRCWQWFIDSVNPASGKEICGRCLLILQHKS